MDRAPAGPQHWTSREAGTVGQHSTGVCHFNYQNISYPRQEPTTAREPAAWDPCRRPDLYRCTLELVLALTSVGPN